MRQVAKHATVARQQDPKTDPGCLPILKSMIMVSYVTLCKKSCFYHKMHNWCEFCALTAPLYCRRRDEMKINILGQVIRNIVIKIRLVLVTGCIINLGTGYFFCKLSMPKSLIVGLHSDGAPLKGL